MTATIGLDIGGTKIAAAVVDETGAVVASVRTTTPAHEGPDAVLDHAADAVRRVAGQVGLARPELLGVGTAGVVDRRSGVIVAATAALPGWAGTDVRGGLADRLDGLRPVVVNDVHAFALAEGWCGTAAGTEDYLALTVGTGIGGAVVVGGRLVAGAHHRAGHLGHVAVPQADGVPCPCGATGHLEAVASGPAMVAALRAAGADVRTAQDVARALAAGDDRAHAVVRTAGAAIGTAVASLAAVVDPALVVLGGGALGVGDLLLDTARRAVAERSMPPLGDLPLHRSRLAEPVAVGAVRAVRLVLAEAR